MHLKTKILLLGAFFFLQKLNAQINWSIEDLRVITFRNGDRLMEVNSESNWKFCIENQIPAYYKLGNSLEDGVLYNFYAIIDDRQLAPLGYTIPELDDVKSLNSDQFFQSAFGRWRTSTSKGYFNANANGYLPFESDTFEPLSVGDASYYWTMTKGKALHSIGFVILNGEKGYSLQEMRRENFCSVRCIKNDSEVTEFEKGEQTILVERTKRQEEIHIAKEKAKKEAEEKSFAEEKAKKDADAKRLAQEQVKRDEEAKRLAEEKAKRDLEAKRQSEEAKKQRDENRMTQKEAQNLSSKNNTIYPKSKNEQSKMKQKKVFTYYDLNSTFAYLSVQKLSPNSEYSSLPSGEDILNSNYYHDAFYETGKMGGESGFGIELGGLIQLKGLNGRIPNFMELGIPIDVGYSSIKTNMAKASIDPGIGSFGSYLATINEYAYGIWSIKTGFSASFHAFPKKESYPIICDTYLKLGFTSISENEVTSVYNIYEEVSVIHGSQTKLSGQVGIRLRLYNLVFLEANNNFGLKHFGTVSENHDFYSSDISNVQYNYNSRVSLNHTSVSIGVNLILLLMLL